MHWAVLGLAVLYALLGIGTLLIAFFSPIIGRLGSAHSSWFSAPRGSGSGGERWRCGAEDETGFSHIALSLGVLDRQKERPDLRRIACRRSTRPGCRVRS